MIWRPNQEDGYGAICRGSIACETCHVWRLFDARNLIKDQLTARREKRNEQQKDLRADIIKAGNVRSTDVDLRGLTDCVICINHMTPMNER